MRALYASRPDAEDPLAAAEVGDRPEPEVPEEWALVDVRATSLNHHDLWTLRGVGISADRFPMILGCDAAGVDVTTGDEVVVHAVLSDPAWTGDETLDPRRTLLSERYPGTMAAQVAVPRANLIPKPPELSFAEAACLPTAWLTAYRMLFVKCGLRPGRTVLVQGASGGVAGAAIALARLAGYRVWATARTEAKRAAALDLGAHAAFEPGARLPDRVDAVIETVGAATWSHSLKALRPGGRVVISGATTGAAPAAELNRIFFLQLEVVGSTMGTRAELADLMALLVSSGLRPRIDRVVPLDDGPEALRAMAEGELIGKAVVEPSWGGAS
ncbi:MAG: zinc-binding dehydrogenase [bacterium]